MDAPDQRRYDRSWKVAASLLGIVALIAATATIRLVDVGDSWELLIFFAVMAMVLLVGTMWLVPNDGRQRAREAERSTERRR